MPDSAHYYKILGLGTDATQEQVKQAHRELAGKWHPDRLAHNPELQQLAQEKLKEINNAVDCLKSYHPATRPSNPAPSDTRRPSPEKAASDNRGTDDSRKRSEQDRRRRAESDRRTAAEENERKRQTEFRSAEDARIKQARAKQQALDAEFSRNVRDLYLTAAEQRRRIENGLCWRCGEPLTMSDKLLKQTFHGTCKH